MANYEAKIDEVKDSIYFEEEILLKVVNENGIETEVVIESS